MTANTTPDAISRIGAPDEVSPIIDFDDPHYSPFALDDAAFGDVDDVYAEIATLRAKGKVLEGDPVSLIGGTRFAGTSGMPQFTFLGYKEVMDALGDAQSYSQDIFIDMVGKTFGRTLTVLNPPEHTQIRRVFQKAFLPKAMEKWGDTIISPTINELIDGFIDDGKVNFIEQFSKIYPFVIIYKQLAMPERDIETFFKLASSLIQTTEGLIQYGMEASKKLGIYFEELIAARRAHPGDDLVSLLVNAEVDGEYIPQEEMISFLRQLIAAAGDTTYRSTGALMIGLVQNPDQMAAVRADRSLIPAALEEALRWNGPQAFSPRLVMRDMEVDGVKIPAGAVVHLSQLSANRDPVMFEDPDKFDIFRPRKRNMAFGYGPHVCVGQHLARIEMTHALNAVLDRMDNIRFDPEMPAPRVGGISFRTPKNIHLLFDKIK